MNVIFSVSPALGTRIFLDDQVYCLVAAEPYTRTTDGRLTSLLTWETVCPTAGCGSRFQAMSGLTITSLIRRCGSHRSLTKPVRGRRNRKVRVRVQLP